MEVGLAHTVLGARESRVQGEGARQSETGLGQHWPYMRRRVKVSTQLVQIAKKAELDRKVRFTSLAHLLTPEFLKETWKTINRHGAGGVDGESIEQFESELEQRVQEICVQLRAGVYRAPPVRRVEIPKGPGKAGTRPLGIPTVTDRLLQKAVARILEAIFEADFCDVSYGYRPGRSPHHALQALRLQIVSKKVSHFFEADIRGFLCLSFVVTEDGEGAHCRPGHPEPDWKMAQCRSDAGRSRCPFGGGNSTRRSDFLHSRQHLSAFLAGSVVRKEIQAADPG